jgi:hypothetical protein
MAKFAETPECELRLSRFLRTSLRRRSAKFDCLAFSEVRIARSNPYERIGLRSTATRGADPGGYGAWTGSQSLLRRALERTGV